MAIHITPFGVLSDGRKVEKIVMNNQNGMQVSLLTYGATLAEIYVPDKNGEKRDVLIGFDDLDGFVNRTDYQGVIVGPYANRIGNARFTLDGKEYRLTANEKGVTSLHGNAEFNTAVWEYAIEGDSSVVFTYTSPDGLNGFPGNMNVSVRYTLTDQNEVKLEYSAVSDKKTVINLTNHAYFNLAGYDAGDILGHILTIEADSFTPVDEYSIPTGEIRSVDGTPLDFRTPHAIGERIEADDEQLHMTGGYDHNFCIRGYDGTLRKAAEAYSPVSGIVLTVSTDLPGVQFYAGNFLSGLAGKAGKPIDKRTGFCLETQYYPDTPNRPEFPQCIFDAGETYHSETVFAFSVR